MRIVAATNQDLRQAIEVKRFREDLFYRLHIVPLHLPRLRERPKDVVALAKCFLAEYSRKFARGFKAITPEAEALLVAYRWPGNVRELRHVIERICVMHDAPLLQADHLPKELTGNAHEAQPTAPGVDFPIPSTGINLDSVVDQFTFHLVKKAMLMAKGNVSQAAKLLGMPRGTLRYKLEKYKIGAEC